MTDSNSNYSDLPQGWKIVQLQDIGKIVSGGTPSTKVAEYWEEEICWISPADLSGYNQKYISKGNKSISKFGLEIRDEVTMLVSRNRFKATVPDLIRPREGDLIFLPLMNNFFEITFVEHDDNQAMFYTLGRGRGGNVYVYAIKMKKLVFSNEIIQTGIDDIDANIRGYYPRVRLTLDSVSGKFLNDEIVYVGPPNSYANATTQALVFDFNPNVYIDVYRTIGQFTTGTLRGLTSGASATITVTNENYMDDNAFEDIIDNSRIQAESDEILDWTEVNPFGET